jgi:transposase InsO family protein
VADLHPHRQWQEAHRKIHADKGTPVWCDASPDRTGQTEPNVYIEPFNERLCDECLNEHWFTRLNRDSGMGKEYNEERPKKALGGLTPAAYARQLTEKAITIHHEL